MRQYSNGLVVGKPVQETSEAFYFTHWFIDLKTNVASPRQGRESKRSTVDGKMDEERKMAVRFNRGQSKNIRNTILNAMPEWLVNKAIAEAKSGVRAKIEKFIEDKSLAAAQKYVVEQLARVGVTAEQILAKTMRDKTEGLDVDDIVALSGDLEVDPERHRERREPVPGRPRRDAEDGPEGQAAELSLAFELRGRERAEVRRAGHRQPGAEGRQTHGRALRGGGLHLHRQRRHAGVHRQRRQRRLTVQLRRDQGPVPAHQGRRSPPERLIGGGMHDDYEYPGECDHDDDVMCTHTFFDRSTATYLARKRLVKLIRVRTHWIIAVTPECLSYAYRLAALHEERCGEQMATLCLHDIKLSPTLCTLPKNKVSYDDLVGVIGRIEGASREVVEGRAWILLTSQDINIGMAAIDRWIQTDNLLN